MMAHFKGDETNLESGPNNLTFSYQRCPTTHAHLKVSMNDDIYWTVAGYLKKTATCLTDHNSISAHSTKIARRQLMSKFVS